LDEELLRALRVAYVARLGDKIAAFEAALATGGEASVAEIQRMAHALRGSGGSYGYPQISLAAGDVEDAESAAVVVTTQRLLAVLRSVSSGEAGS